MTLPILILILWPAARIMARRLAQRNRRPLDRAPEHLRGLHRDACDMDSKHWP